ncbi:PAS domain-containing hybrid sensor histidine kinase/response regulator [Flammeovirga pacifica]|uniref:histidine kinase n=1 Tax=Flammeovirga pacifica TaxID=915059 RepID=A0A1S1YWA4_FLAPC|nr:ATP-binding protein [Flammeovirga pacifica]OHX65290.1 hypothetical protein NH26_02470 [Flammeovirga pacifica]
MNTDIWLSIFLVVSFLFLAILIFKQYKVVRKIKFESDKSSIRDFKMLRLLMEHSPDVIYSVDQNYNYLTFNNAHSKAMKSNYGCNIKIGGNILEYMNIKDDNTYTKIDLKRALEGESFTTIRAFGGNDKYKQNHYESTYSPIHVDDEINGAAVFVRDITEQYNANLNLIRSERKYKLLFHYNFLGTLIMIDGVINDANDTAVSFLGLETHELVGSTLNDLFKVEESLNLDEQIKEFFTTYEHPNGDKLYFIIREQTVSDLKENHQTVFIEDVSSKYKAEQQLIKVNTQRQVLLESAKSYIFSINKNYEIETFNTKFKDLFEDKIDFELQPNLSIKSPKLKRELSFFIPHIEQVMRSKELVEVEFEISQDIIFQSTISPLLDENNNLFGVAVYSIDITKEKQRGREIEQLNASLEQKVEERTSELGQQKLKLNLAMDAAQIGAWSYIKNDGFEWDQKFSEIFGIKYDQNIEAVKKIRSLIKDSDLEKVIDLIQKIKAEELDEIDLLVKINHKKLGLQYIQVYGRSLRDNGRYEMYGMIWNITNQKNIEHELEQAKELAEKSNRAKSMFLANISHEIRSPLNAIIGFSNILSKKSEALNLPEEYIDQLKYIYLNGEYLSELINNLLDMSKIDAGKLSVFWEEIDIRDLINMVVKIHEVISSERSIQIKLFIDDAIPNRVVLDATKLRQILTNLLSNAIKFSQKGTSIMVELQKVNEEIIISVKDKGIGIPQSKLDVIFDSFEQADKSVTRKFGGTGLGLAITKKLVKLLKGDVRVFSEENVGTTFTVSLPLKVNPSKGEEVVNQEVIERDFNFEYHVLVVEDNKMNQIMMSALLKQLKINIEIANNGEEAIDKIEGNHFDLILMDLHMPIMGGIDATKIIRFEKKILDIPIVALTADTYWDKRFEAFSVGMNNYLTKPLSRHSLLQVLEQYLINFDQTRINYLDPIKHKAIIEELKEIPNSTIMTDHDKLDRLKSLRHVLQDYDTGFIEYIDFLTNAIANKKEIEIF